MVDNGSCLFREKQVLRLLGGSTAHLIPSLPSRPVLLLDPQTLLAVAQAASPACRRRAQGPDHSAQLQDHPESEQQQDI